MEKGCHSRRASWASRDSAAQMNPNPRNGAVIVSRSNNVFDSLNRNSEGPEIHQKQPKIPPITVSGVDILKLKEKLANVDGFDGKNLKFKLTEKGIKIFTNTAKDHAIIKNQCIRAKFECFTHTYEEDKKIKMCLYGLYDINPDTIRAELSSKNVKTADIKLLKPKKSTESSRRIYIVFFDKKDNIKAEKLNQMVPELFNVMIKWRQYINYKYIPTQCSRCLDFGHGSHHCHRQYRCIRCGSNHKSENCPFITSDQEASTNMETDSSSIEHNITPTKKKIDRQNISCANCQGNHTANYGGCPYRRKYVNFRKIPKQSSPYREQNLMSNTSEYAAPAPIQSIKPTPSAVNPMSTNKPTFSQIASTRIPRSNPHEAPQNSESSEELFSSATMRKILNEMLVLVARCRTRADQVLGLAEIVQKYLTTP